MIDQTLQTYFPNYTPPADNKANPNPQSNPSPGGGSSTPPPNTKPGDTSPIKDIPVGTPTIVPIPINLPAPPLDNSSTIKTVAAPVTIAVIKTVDVSPVVDNASFVIGNQVKITDSATSDTIVPYVPGTAKIASAIVVSTAGPASIPPGTDLTTLVTLDPTTGGVSYNPAQFAFLGPNQNVVYTFGFDSSAGADTFSETLTVTINGINVPPVITQAALRVAQGGTVVLTPANINVTDSHSASFVFAVSNVTHGTFQVTADGTTWVDTGTFTSADLSAGHVRFAQNGDPNTPTFSIQADDGTSANHLSNLLAGIVDLASAPTVLISTTGVTTNQSTQTITGTVDIADIGTTVMLYDNGNTTPIGTATVGSGGGWTTNVVLLGDGTHSIVAKDTDTAGNTGASGAVLFTIDTSAPAETLAITAIAPDTGSSSSDFITSATTLWCRVIAGCRAGSGTSWATALTNFTPKAHVQRRRMRARSPP
jgi:hypothetical protein